MEVRLGIPQEEMTDMDILMLVVPNTIYHDRVPNLLGTNVLSYLKTQVKVKDSRFRMGSCVSHVGTTGNLSQYQRFPWFSDRQEATNPPSQWEDGNTWPHQSQDHLSKDGICLDGSAGLPKGVLATPRMNTLQPGQKRTKLPVELVNDSAHTVTVCAICTVLRMSPL